MISLLKIKIKNYKVLFLVKMWPFSVFVPPIFSFTTIGITMITVMVILLGMFDQYEVLIAAILSKRTRASIIVSKNIHN